MKASKNEKSIKVDLTQENKVAVLNKLRPRISGYHLEIVYPSIDGPRYVVTVEVRHIIFLFYIELIQK